MLIKKLLQSKLVLFTATVIGFAPILIGTFPAKAQLTDGIRNEEIETGEPELLERGSRGDNVKNVQRYLRDRGYFDGPIDGVYGPKTEQGVRNFESDNDMNVDGRFDEENWSDYDSQKSSTTPPITSEEQLSPTDWINDGEDPAGSDVYE